MDVRTILTRRISMGYDANRWIAAGTIVTHAKIETPFLATFKFASPNLDSAVIIEHIVRNK